jgi:hypothetical protein
MVKEWLKNPKLNFGIVILNEDGVNVIESSKTFYSSKCGSNALMPKLEITICGSE